MNKLLHKLLKPNKVLLTIYGILSFIFLTFYVWKLSFMWFFNVNDYLVGVVTALTVCLFIATIIDKKFNFRLKRYLMVSLVQLIIIWIISDPIRTWQIQSSYEKAQNIIYPLSTYKNKYDTYPLTLSELSETLNKDIPTRTNIGTYYLYDVNRDSTYSIWFLSYYGYTAYYYSDKDEWLLMD